MTLSARQMQAADALAFLTVQVAVAALFIGCYAVLGFELTVVIILSVIAVQVAQP